MAAFVTADAQEVMRKEKDGTYVVNTTTLAQDVKGYIGATPVEIYIKKNKIVKVSGNPEVCGTYQEFIPS